MIRFDDPNPGRCDNLAAVSLVPLSEGEECAMVADFADVLRDQMLDALMHDPMRTVQTPAWRDATCAAVEAVSCEATPEMLAELIRVVAACAEGKGGETINRMRAMAIIATIAAEHGATHAEAGAGL